MLGWKWCPCNSSLDCIYCLLQKSNFFISASSWKLPCISIKLGKLLILRHLQLAVFPCIYNSLILKSSSNRLRRAQNIINNWLGEKCHMGEVFRGKVKCFCPFCCCFSCTVSALIWPLSLAAVKNSDRLNRCKVAWKWKIISPLKAPQWAPRKSRAAAPCFCLFPVDWGYRMCQNLQKPPWPGRLLPA